MLDFHFLMVKKTEEKKMKKSKLKLNIQIPPLPISPQY